MHRTTTLCILLVLASSSNQFQLVKDDDLQGIVLQPLKPTYVQATTKFLTYSISTIPLRYLNENRAKIEEHCPNLKIDLLLLNETLKDLKIIWNTESNTTIMAKNIIRISPHSLTDLRTEITLLSNNNCNYFESVKNNILHSNRILNDMAKLNFQSLHELIDPVQIQSDTFHLIGSFKDRYVTPFHVKRFDQEFWNIVDSKFKFHNDSVFIEFEIPFFDPNIANMFSVHSKPIKWHNNTYLYNAPLQFAIVTPEKTYSYSEEDYFENCFISSNITHCKTSKFKPNPCFEMVLNTNKQAFNENCFTRLKIRNMITQIDKQLFLTIFKPLILLVSRDRFEFPIRIEQSSKLYDISEYNISTSFFKFDTRNGGKYAIFAAENDSDDYLSYKFEFEITWTRVLCDLTMVVCSILMIVILLVLSTATITASYQRLKQVLLNSCQ